MLVVALTGNIATGKSLVGQYFADLGRTVINADRIAAEIGEDPAIKAQIIEHFGNKILKNKQIHRPALRQIIFNNSKEKKWLEDLLHPLIRKEIERQISNTDSEYVIVEIPLHFKREDYPYLNKVIVVHADEAFQTQRIMERDHCTLSEALAAIKNQPGIDTRLEIADDLINNNGDKAALMEQVLRLDRKYKNISG